MCTPDAERSLTLYLLITATKLPTEQEHHLPVQGSSHVPTAAAEAPSLFHCGLGPSGTKSFQRGCSFLKGRCWPALSQQHSSQPQHLCQRSQRSLVSPALQLPHPEVNAESQGRRRCPCNCWWVARRAEPPMLDQQPSASWGPALQEVRTRTAGETWSRGDHGRKGVGIILQNKETSWNQLWEDWLWTGLEISYQQHHSNQQLKNPKTTRISFYLLDFCFVF